MTPEWWLELERLFRDMCDGAPENREVFLDRVCGDDAALRREVAAWMLERTAVVGAEPPRAADADGLAAGYVIGHYEILGRLGKGGMGEVYLARDTRLGRRVALKVLPEDFARDADRVRRFRQEARVTSALEHPNILTVFDVGVDGPLHYMAAEYVEGATLRDRLAAGPLPLDEAVDVATAVASALGAAHAAGVVHRDIKPSNLMIRPDGMVKVLDFGISKRIATPGADSLSGTRDALVTVPGTIVGTARYASPEQIQGLDVDGRTDLWSLGVVLYEMIVGRHPFEGATYYHLMVGVIERDAESLGRSRPDVPADLERTVARALAKTPDARYRSAEEMVVDLRRLAGGFRSGATVPRAAVEPTVALADPHEATATLISHTAPNNLPEPVTSFIGRVAQIGDVVRLLEASRLVTLTGTGGIGKTRLALEVARKVASGDVDGVWFVELAGLTDPAFVPTAVVMALGADTQPGLAPAEALARALGAQRTFVVLDNCEHLVEACARLVDVLLRACPSLRVVATSREPLAIDGEVVWPLPTLTVPEADAPVSARGLADHEAPRLFVERAAFSRPDFAATDRNVSAIADVCRRLDGIPLAIELAAARVRVLSVEQISARLDDCFQLLTGGSRVAPRRQQTLRAAMDWSHDLLSERERILLRRLSIFAGGFTLQAAEAVAGLDECEGRERSDSADVLDVLARLVDSSLVLVDEVEDASVRYRMYETVIQYATEKLREAGEELLLRKRHRDWFLGLAEEAATHLTGPLQSEWVSILEREHDNLNAALHWSVEVTVDRDASLRLCFALGRFWSMHAHLSEGRAWLERALLVAPDPGNPMRPRVLLWAGQLARLQGDRASASARYASSLACARELDDRDGTAAALSELFILSINGGDVDRAERYATEALGIFRAIGNRRGESLALAQLGNVASERGDWDRAVARYEPALAIIREIGDKRSMSTLLGNLGRIAGFRGDYERGRALIGEGLAIVRELGDKTSIGFFIHAYGLVAAQAGEYDLALRHYAESLAAYEEVDSKQDIAEVLESISSVEVALGEARRAVCLVGAAAAIRESIGVPVSASDGPALSADLDAAHDALGPAGFARALAEGRAMTRDEAVAYATADRHSHSSGAR